MNKEELYSRQIKAIGKKTMEKLENIKIQILGINNISIELLKCLTLMGIGEIIITNYTNTITNNFITKMFNLNNVINLNEFINSLKKLNNYIKISSSKKILNNVDLIIQSDSINYNPLEISKFTRKNNIKYILGISKGFTGYIFSDLIDHTILNLNGDKKGKDNIYNINIDLNLKRTYFNISNNSKFENNKFKIKIPNENDKIYKYLKINKTTGYINDIVNLNKDQTYNIEEVKDYQNIKYKSLSDVLSLSLNNETLININIKDKSIIKNDIYNIITKNKQYLKYIIPEPGFLIISSFIGSCIAQEVIKLSGKYMPINQELLIDYTELYNKQNLYKTVNKKFKNIYKLLSKKVLKYLNKVNIFLVGCGALGCEYLKFLSLINTCNKQLSNLYVTDMDTIEVSNLNRQFLFQNDDINKFKSLAAKKKILKINNTIKIVALTDKVCSTTENQFNKDFWSNIDIVINALDNIDARKYIDNKCVIYNKPLFEAGTLGMKSNSQVIIPYLTSSYSDTLDPVTNKIPVCTLKNFPFNINHCVQWSLDKFNKYFTDLIHYIKLYSINYINFKNKILDNISNEYLILDILNLLYNARDLMNNPNINNLLKFSYIVYYKLFINPIKEILTIYPENSIDSNGNKFWKGNKKLPKIINCKVLKFQFIKLFSKLLSKCLNINLDIQVDLYFKNIEKNKVKNINSIFNKYKIENIENIENILKNNFSSCVNPEICKFNINNELHLSLITLMCNIRAKNYQINIIDKKQCKSIIDNITPALSTTTTIITALSIMEMLKYVNNKVNKIKINNYNDYFINSGLNLYLQSRSQNPKKIIKNKYSKIFGMKIRTIPDIINTWDKIIIKRFKNGIETVNDLIVFLNVEFNINPSIISINNLIIYSKFNLIQKNSRFFEIYDKLNIIKSEYLNLNISCISENSIPILTPRVLYEWDI